LSTIPPPAAPAVVLDTNTVLDWLVFKDAGVAALVAAVEGGQLRWLACPAMRRELTRTLGYRSLAQWQPDSERVLSTFDAMADLRPEPPVAALPLRCSDPDDQVFLDLALATGARWLVSHDKALLRLARRVRPLGLRIVTPKGWHPEPAPA
jgi:putative PIN family toxin of toxin-antitoxin system